MRGGEKDPDRRELPSDPYLSSCTRVTHLSMNGGDPDRPCLASKHSGKQDEVFGKIWTPAVKLNYKMLNGRQFTCKLLLIYIDCLVVLTRI